MILTILLLLLLLDWVGKIGESGFNSKNFNINSYVNIIATQHPISIHVNIKLYVVSFIIENVTTVMINPIFNMV